MSIGSPLELYWIYVGSLLDTYRISIGSWLDVPWMSIGSPLDPCWFSNGYFLHLLKECWTSNGLLELELNVEHLMSSQKDLRKPIEVQEGS